MGNLITPDIWERQRRQVDSGDGGGDDGGMEARISALEAANIETRERLARIETRLDSVATKADLSSAVAALQTSFTGVERSLHALTWRIIGSCALLVGAAYFIAKHIS
ncbi:hypothetical protein KDW82_04190 [Burkholderia vietnamiensis]|uniref:hypothetical protein n=1 Tax=Burkholderia vietnamiensis TaxID=60552 RepID=UPI001B95B875|nr:hypothetical protein [Burkholderia vietnamiensis]MBR8188260.1 hypothetical protein [Burkholderia vietnamiensis]